MMRFPRLWASLFLFIMCLVSPGPSLGPGNAETLGVQYWIIKPHGDGQAIIPVPKDGSNTVMYLTASGFLVTVAVTVSPFPVSWVIIPTSDSPTSPPLTGSTVPPGLTEEWTAQICWPHSNNNVPRLLDLYAGNPAPDTNAVLYPYGATQQQFWRIQFLQYQSTAHCGRIKRSLSLGLQEQAPLIRAQHPYRTLPDTWRIPSRRSQRAEADIKANGIHKEVVLSHHRQPQRNAAEHNRF
ncbi:hypothetical protein B0H13DRAFT_1877174 [Mycena leptocephala]|nr:hypothetical protein B0H13DRAFT_1877174 [Mycena leptocephala]